MSKQKTLGSIIAILICFSVGGLNVYGQCGIHFRRASTWSFPVQSVTLDSAAADMTGDGLPDLLASDEGPGWTVSHIFIIPNLGNGNFGEPSTTLTASAGQAFNDTYYPVFANNDNRPDLVIYLGDSGLPNTFRIYINNGNGTFTPGPTNSIGELGSFVDLNNDGFSDHVSWNGSSLETRYNLGNGDGSFGPHVSLGSHGGSTGDFNGDGRIDFLHSNHLHLNNGDLTWGTIDIGNVLANRTTWAYADFDVDGKLDIVTAPTSGSLSFGILTSTGTGFTVTDHPVSVDPSWIGYPWVGNWGGNSAPDIVFQPRYQSKKVVFINNGTGNFTQQIYDGRIDITTGQHSAYADFDNDGKVDRIRATSSISNSRIMLRDVTSFTFEKQVCDQPGQPRIVDYDRSNSTDWSFWNPATGDWSRRTLATQSGPPASEETVNWGLGSLGDVPTPGDFDGDGVTDRAVYRDSTGYWYVRRSSDLVWFVFRFGLPGDKPVVGDYDGDTISDIAVWRPSDGNWYIWYMGPQQFGALHFGLDGDKPVQADFDGDLKTDVAVYRPSTGVWYYFRSSDGNYAVVPWGISTDKPIPADFDGDGKADITVYRESDKIVYILRSTTGTPTYYQWGIAGDILQIGDYDGDFVADLGVYRPSNRSWWTTTIPPWGLFVYGVDGAVPTSSLVRFE